MLSYGINPLSRSETQFTRQGKEVKILSTEELVALVNEHPEYRSKAQLGRYLNVSPSTAEHYLKSVGIQPMTLREAKFVENGRLDVKIPSAEELINLLEEHPEYRSASRLSMYLEIGVNTAYRLLLSYGIKPLNNQEANLIRHHNLEEVKILSAEELRRLVEEHPEYRSSTRLGKYLGVSDSSASNYLNGAGITSLSNERVKDAPSFQQFLETDEEAQQMVEAAEQLAHYLESEEYKKVLQATAQRIHERMNDQRGHFTPERIIYAIRKQGIGVVMKPYANGDITQSPVETLGRAYQVGILPRDIGGRLVGRLFGESLQSQAGTPDELDKAVERLEKEVMNVN